MSPHLTFALFFALFPICISGQTVFEPPRQLEFPSLQHTVASADLDEDGLPDIISGGESTDTDSSRIYVSMNEGGGKFSTPRAYNVGGAQPGIPPSLNVEKILVADLNNDGHSDLIVGYQIHVGSPPLFRHILVSILLGTGKGSLQTPIELSGPVSPFEDPAFWTYVVQDIDGDGLKDIAAVFAGTDDQGSIYRVRNLGSGNFQVAGPVGVFGGYGLAAGRFDRDSLGDLAFSADGGVTLVFGSNDFGSLSMTSFERFRTFGEIVSGDFNNDGYDDLAATSPFQTKSFLVLTRRMIAWPVFPVNISSYQTRIFPDVFKTYDIDGDGRADLILADGRTGGMEIFYSTGSGEFIRSSSAYDNTPAGDLVVDDFNNDGKADILTSNGSNSSPVQAQLFLQTSERPEFEKNHRFK